MIYYPLTTLMLAGIREILIIFDGPHGLPLFSIIARRRRPVGAFRYPMHPNRDRKVWRRRSLLVPNLSKEAPSALIFLVIIFFFGHGLPDLLARAVKRAVGADGLLPITSVDPERYGVGSHLTKREKPPPSRKSRNTAEIEFRGGPGLYFYDEQVCR